MELFLFLMSFMKVLLFSEADSLDKLSHLFFSEDYACRLKIKQIFLEPQP